MTSHRSGDGSSAGVLAPDTDSGRSESLAAMFAPLMRRLQAMDVINRGMMFSAVLLLCLVPFCIVVQAVAGGSIAARMASRWGLSSEAADVVGKVFTGPASPSAGMTVASWLVLIAFAVGAAATLQELYVASFGVDRPAGAANFVRLLVWMAALFGVSALGGLAQPSLSDGGGTLLVLLASFFVATAFWWLTMWLLLAGQLSWSELFPSAVATGVFWVGMVLVFRLTLSDMIVSNNAKYGAIGVVFCFMYLMVAIGVVVILGAITGAVWRERAVAEAP